ncbi:ABC transporter substrate-binding protein [Chloroflexota bacterium]
MSCLVSVIISGLFASCTAPADEAAPFTIEVTDQLGRVVKLEKVPERIVSLAPSNTEILFALGLADKLVGVTEYCDYPEAAKDKPKIGGYATVDIERVVEIQPDLILATGYHEAEVIPKLERLGLTVLTLDPRSLDEILEAITLAGKCTGKEDEASQLVTDMEKRVNAITEKTTGLSASARPRVFYIVYRDPLMTVGSDTLTHELIVKAGGINIAQDLTGDYPTMGLEAVIAANPQVIVASYGHGSVEDLPLQFALTEPRLSDVDARVNNQVYGIDTDVGSRPGLRIVDGLELLAKMIHPEIFGPVE